VTTGHLMRLGAREIPRERYLEDLERSLRAASRPGRWAFDEDAFAGASSDISAQARRPKTARGRGGE
jgi:hypothetical protein